MILVELDTGDQRVFASPGELADAIKRGEVSPSARIYHRAAAQWLPITVHPHFRENAAQRWSAPLPPLARTRWTFFSTDSPEPPALESPAASQPRRANDPSAAASPPTDRHGTSGWRSALGRAMRHIRPGGKS